MTREIKFRAWIEWNGNKTMYYPGDPDLVWLPQNPVKTFFLLNLAGDLISCKEKNEDGDLIETCYARIGHTWELMQFTGLKDVHGKDIYEGDVIMPVEKRYPFYDEGKPNYVGTIEWCFEGFHCVLNCVNGDKAGISDGVNEPFEESEWCEVIGNIYENPDLLTPSSKV